MSGGTLTIVGPGSIVFKGKFEGVQLSGSASLVLESGTVTISSTSNDYKWVDAIYNSGSGSVTVGGGKGTAKLYANGGLGVKGGCGIRNTGSGSVTVKSNADIMGEAVYRTAGDDGTRGYGIYSAKGAVSVEGGKVFGKASLTGTHTARGYGIYSEKGAVTVSGGTVKGEGTSGARGFGVYTESGSVTVKGTAELIGQGHNGIGHGICVKKNNVAVDISGGVVKGFNEGALGRAVGGDGGSVNLTVSDGYLGGNMTDLASGRGLSGGYYTVEPPAEHIATGYAAFECQKTYAGVKHTWTIKPLVKTTLTPKKSSPTSVKPGVDFQLKVTLKDKDGKPLSGRTVTCGDVTAVTDNNGVATFSFPAMTEGEERSYTFVFDGDTQHAGSQCVVDVKATSNPEPAPKPTPPPKTGDNTPILLLSALAVLSIAGLAIVGRKRRKER